MYVPLAMSNMKIMKTNPKESNIMEDFILMDINLSGVKSPILLLTFFLVLGLVISFVAVHLYTA